jgi:2-amino-4-hydroxy-6-hydroxymethyldihydropteridine diphosphokinase
MPEIFVAAGSNIQPRARLRQAIALMREAWPDLRVSGAYLNKTVGFEGDDFINLVTGFQSDEPLSAVLEKLHAIETACGRPRHAPKWASRSMDLDVLLYGDAVGEFPGAVVPRPDLAKRPYMLRPLAEIAADTVHPATGRTLGDMWARFDSAGHQMVPVELEGED